MKNGLISKIVELHKLISGMCFFAKPTNAQQFLLRGNEKFNSPQIPISVRSKWNIFPSTMQNSKFLFLSILLLFSVFTSCNKFFKKKETAEKYVIFPSPPDPPRFQFLTKISNSSDIEPAQSNFSKMVIGEAKMKGMVKPYGIVIKKGKIYVCDNYVGGMEIIDLEKKRFDYFAPLGKGMLRIPINCFVDDKGYLYVADAGKMQVMIYDEKGTFIKAIGEKEKFKPSDVNVYDNKIFVANSANSQICVYSNDSLNTLLYTIPRENDPASLHLCMPTNIAISEGKVYAADFGCSQVKIYSTDGTFLDTIGGPGDGPTKFTKLKGVAVDRDANVYCVDAAFENVQVFNKEKQFLMDFGGHFQGDGGLLLPAKISIDYDNLKYFQKYVDPRFDLKFLIFVTSQYGPNLINVFGRVEPKATPPDK